MYRADVWLWSLDAPADRVMAARALLSEDEIGRAARFVRQVHRDRYILGRARLRRLLGAETGRDPRDISFTYGENGKPLLRDGPHFNLSHSEDTAALAISRDLALGIDIEKHRPIEDSVARYHFSPDEYAELGCLDGGRWLEGFYRCWTRKEAIIKTDGQGLSRPLDSFDVSLTPGTPARLIRIEGDEPEQWRLLHFDPGPGWSGAVAARTGGEEIRLNWRTAHSFE
ncbi:4'-phosphopantetheinyl transferase family protein [Ruegeria marina]|uniref:4'-phosphopantetheinyl transferase n=1 Tax=Ruegeria marina TaxID=639004 RepID=A0A1G6IDH5_9RHOB|nr:4'-phosphopantetheinyl transferase superfamily protein [Ruegeria marina]SDC04055.1 4'-phosphopantetheinyl transferase [Ruegeria marina]